MLLVCVMPCVADAAAYFYGGKDQSRQVNEELARAPLLRVRSVLDPEPLPTVQGQHATAAKTAPCVLRFTTKTARKEEGG